MFYVNLIINNTKLLCIFENYNQIITSMILLKYRSNFSLSRDLFQTRERENGSLFNR